MKVAAATQWLTRQPVLIPAMRQINVTEGVAVLDGKLRSPVFISFMKQRQESSIDPLSLGEELWELLKEQLARLVTKHQIVGLVPLPSRTWGARNTTALHIGEHLNVPVLNDLLYWHKEPQKRQGQLSNNDQRQHNVKGCMSARLMPIPNKGTLLLLDDYIGSGATLKEAARVLRKEVNLVQPLAPFTIASVKWRLGQPGFV